MNPSPRETPSAKQARLVTLGIGSILLSSLLFAPTSQTATKYLTSDFPLIQIVFFRSLGQTLWMMMFFWPKHGAQMFRTSRPGLQIGRSSLLFVSSLFWITGVSVVPLATASSIGFTAPLMVVMMSVPLLGEHVGMHRWMAVFVGFVGALVVVRPGAGSELSASLMLLVAAFMFALYQILTRKVAGVDGAATTSIYTVLVALTVSAFMVPWHFVAPAPGDVIVWLAFLATGLLGGLRHFFVVKAYEFAPASVVSPFFYCELVGVTILGFLVFGDLPDLWTAVGAIIIVSSGLYIAHRERVRSRQH